MKKLYVIATFILVSGLGLIAQEFNAGVYGGIAASQLDGDLYAGYNKVGVIAGTYVNRKVNKLVFMQMGLRYFQKGSKRADTKNNVYYKTMFHYVEIPVTARYYYYSKLDFEAGLALGYLFKGLEDVGNGFGLVDANPEFRKMEFSGILGINYKLSDKTIVGAQFSYSILPTRPFNKTFSTIMDKGQHNNVIALTLMYHISSWK